MRGGTSRAVWTEKPSTSSLTLLVTATLAVLCLCFLRVRWVLNLTKDTGLKPQKTEESRVAELQSTLPLAASRFRRKGRTRPNLLGSKNRAKSRPRASQKKKHTALKTEQNSRTTSVPSQMGPASARSISKGRRQREVKPTDSLRRRVAVRCSKNHSATKLWAHRAPIMLLTLPWPKGVDYRGKTPGNKQSKRPNSILLESLVDEVPLRFVFIPSNHHHHHLLRALFVVLGVLDRLLPQVLAPDQAAERQMLQSSSRTTPRAPAQVRTRPESLLRQSATSKQLHPPSHELRGTGTRVKCHSAQGNRSFEHSCAHRIQPKIARAGDFKPDIASPRKPGTGTYERPPNCPSTIRCPIPADELFRTARPQSQASSTFAPSTSPWLQL